MSDADVIKEFLIKLGYKISPADQMKFDSNVKDSTDLVKGLGVMAVTATAAPAAAKIVTRRR